MPTFKKLSAAISVALATTCTMAAPVLGQELDFFEYARPTKPGGGGSGGTTVRSPTLYSWIHPEVQLAWDQGFYGQGVTTTVVDDFSSFNRYRGNLGDGSQRLRHGEWTLKEAGMVATSSTMVAHDFYSARAVSLTPGFDVLNLSYGMVDVPGYETIAWSAQERSIIDAARANTAFVSKAAGNDYGTAIGGTNSSGKVDYLGRDLIGAAGAVFVGALEENGSVSDPARIASYSNIAGANTTVQEQFLVVGVESGTTGLAGTSFAAPIVSGYAGILSSKFNTESPGLIADRLLLTAREDTIAGYNRSIHGEGEASIARALAPDAITATSD